MFCIIKQSEIQQKLDANPTFTGEMHGDGDVYSQVFTEERVSRSKMYGFDLLVGVKNSVMQCSNGSSKRIKRRKFPAQEYGYRIESRELDAQGYGYWHPERLGGENSGF